MFAQRRPDGECRLRFLISMFLSFFPFFLRGKCLSHIFFYIKKSIFLYWALKLHSNGPFGGGKSLSFQFLTNVAIAPLIWDIRLKIRKLLNVSMLFQFQLAKSSKSEGFSCLQKVDHVTNYCKRPTFRVTGTRSNLCHVTMWRHRCVANRHLSERNARNYVSKWTLTQACWGMAWG